MELNTGHLLKFIDKKQLQSIKGEVKEAHFMLEKGTGLGSNFLGWLHLPSSTTKKALSDIEDAASSIRNSSDVFIVIGIGGSYLGSRAAIEFLCPSYRENKPVIFFVGNSLDPSYHYNLIKSLKNKRISVNVISKSGTTTEPAVAFRIIRELLEKRYSKPELKKRIICTTTNGKGALWNLAKNQGYRCFYIPENIGGRFSVLTAVGLLPMAVAGIDVKEVMKGSCDIEGQSKSYDIDKNIPYYYAALRNILYRNGKRIEIISTFHTQLYYVLEWWKQIFAETEGKQGKGLFPTTAVFSTDLHSIGQLIQEGERNILETFLMVKKADHDVKIPYDKDDSDNINYLGKKGVGFVNTMAYKGTALAHAQGDIPNMTLSIDERSPYCLGQLYYFLQRSAGVSGYLLGVNPFNQPGVEAYKQNMFKLLGKP